MTTEQDKRLWSRPGRRGRIHIRGPVASGSWIEFDVLFFDRKMGVIIVGAPEIPITGGWRLRIDSGLQALVLKYIAGRAQWVDPQTGTGYDLEPISMAKER